ncbi:MAG: hypothetical protein A2Y92_00835 [Chloroflexi bacterium RBG_13_57_8]|nr:MAG: hypothetical protein A2Y92_00835 [Chloroflexi bacterium RBG_13_57_8]
MQERRIAGLFLEIFLVVAMLVTLSAIAFPRLDRLVDRSGRVNPAEPVGSVAGLGPASPGEKTLAGYFQDLTDFAGAFNEKYR